MNEIAVILLAAGRSSRMAPQHKLLLPTADGRPMVARVADNLLAAGLPLITVTGHRAPEVEAALAGRAVRVVPVPDWAEGLSASLRAGLAAVPGTCRAAIIALGDMPLVTPTVLTRLVAAYDPSNRPIVVPVHAGQWGNPVLWDRRFFVEMMALTGDRGARGLLDRYRDQVATIDVTDDGVLRDVDTTEAFAALPDAVRGHAEISGRSVQ